MSFCESLGFLSWPGAPWILNGSAALNLGRHPLFFSPLACGILVCFSVRDGHLGWESRDKYLDCISTPRGCATSDLSRLRFDDNSLKNFFSIHHYATAFWSYHSFNAYKQTKQNTLKGHPTCRWESQYLQEVGLGTILPFLGFLLPAYAAFSSAALQLTSWPVSSLLFFH